MTDESTSPAPADESSAAVNRRYRGLGYCQDEFDPTDPGRLCRGRERWIEPLTADEAAPPKPKGLFDEQDDEVAQKVFRLVLSGAFFSDDSARDALRGVPHSGVDTANVIAALFPRRTLLAFMEDGHPADIPEDASHVELYTSWRAGGRHENLSVRWTKAVNGIREIRAVIGDAGEAASRTDADEQRLAPAEMDRVRGFVLLEGDEPSEALLEAIFFLVGMTTQDSPPARFQPSALPDLLKLTKAVILLHRDKHGPALGIYTAEPLKVEARLEPLCEKAGSLLVPFAIPPMLARWDRAVSDLRATWDEAVRGAFPIPASGASAGWEPRRRGRRWRDRRDDGESEAVGEDGADAGGEA